MLWLLVPRLIKLLLPVFLLCLLLGLLRAACSICFCFDTTKKVEADGYWNGYVQLKLLSIGGSEARFLDWSLSVPAARKGYKLIPCPAFRLFSDARIDHWLYISLYIVSGIETHLIPSFHSMTRKLRRLSPHHRQSDCGKQKSAAVELIAMWCWPFIDFVTLQRLQSEYSDNVEMGINLFVSRASTRWFFELHRSYFSVSRRKKKHHKMKVIIGLRIEKKFYKNFFISDTLRKRWLGHQKNILFFRW